MIWGEGRDDGGRFLVAENLGVGQASAVVDRDVCVLSADRLSSDTGCAGVARVVAVSQPIPDTLAGTALDLAELRDVDIDQLSSASTLVAPCWLETEPAELAHPDPRRDPRRATAQGLLRRMSMSE